MKSSAFINEDASQVPSGGAAGLVYMAQRHPDATCVAIASGVGKDGETRYVELTFAELDQLSDHMAHALEAVGVTKGVRTVLMVPPSPEFFALLFALLKVEAVMVLADPGMGAPNLAKCLAEARPQAFIGISKAHAARVILGWAKKTIEIPITVGRRLFWGGTTLAKMLAQTPAKPYGAPKRPGDQVSSIIFTSGSTGVPKGVVYRYELLAAQCRLLKKTYGIEPGEFELSTFPPFASYGPENGTASVIPAMDTSRPGTADPRALVAGIERYRCASMFANPAVLDKLGRYCESHKVRLPTLRRIVSAGAEVSPAILKRFEGVLEPGVEILTPYGATEALPVSSIGSTTILRETAAKTDSGAGVCVGKPVPEVRVAIIPISDEPIATWADTRELPPNEVGEIVVSGPIISHSYFEREAATRLAKIEDPAGVVTWHRMGDLGYLDEEGRLWMCGRKGHRVQTKDGPMFTVSCEAVFNTHPKVWRTALVGVGRAGEMKPVIIVQLEPEHTNAAKGSAGEALIAELRAIGSRYPHTRSIDTFLFHPNFPVDVRHNAKIMREKLAVWAAQKL